MSLISGIFLHSVFVKWHLTFALHVDVCSQNTMKSVKSVSSSRAYLLVKDQLAKAKASVVQYQALYEKLQVLTISCLSFRGFKAHLLFVFCFCSELNNILPTHIIG